ncbi:MAG: helix-turn-helix domain-containing protein [Xanthobacteraceae bacterium]|nr:helix-turn-helix domain-containing protein [Xanthobacteraceae bacterium]
MKSKTRLGGSRVVTSFRSVVRTYAAGHVTPRHDHDWPQLLYASSGVMSVETANGSWIVPPQRAIWLPSRTWHITRMMTEVRLASLYLRQTRGSPTTCEILEIGPLMRELLVAAIDVDFSGPLSRRQKALAALIAEELAIAPRGGSPIPMPEDRRLLPFCQRVLKDPSLHINLEEHASAFALTPKTVSRLFQRELGMNFRDWRQLVQSTYALAHLIQGEPVKVIASRLGYTPSAFSVMMRRNLRAAPVHFRGNTALRSSVQGGPAKLRAGVSRRVATTS